jgi:DNA-binding transcriptional LysR family regulator
VELRDIRSFVFVAREGTLTAAAAQLHLTPAAVHKQLRNLELELGVSLYEREGRRLTITRAGDVFLPFATELLAQHEEAIRAMHEWHGVRRGSVRIGGGPSISSHILPPLLREFRNRHPSVELQVETGSSRSLLDQLRSGKIDLALLVSAQKEESIYTVDIRWDIEFVLVGALPKPLRRISLHRLKDQQFVLFDRTSRSGQLIDSYFASHRFQPSSEMRSDSAEAIRSMVLAGLGIAFLPAWTVASDVKAGTLQRIHLKEPPLLCTMEAVRRRSSNGVPAIQSFLDVARSVRLPSLRG